MKIKQTIQEETLAKESIFIVGRVSSVEGRKVKVKVNKDKNLSHLSYKGQILKNVSVGNFVKITKGFIEILGQVDGEYITEEKVFNAEYKKEETKISRILEITLFGSFEGDQFVQGIKEMPLLDNECYLLSRDEFNQLHQFYKTNERVVDIGVLTEEPSQEIKVSADNLFASHIGIFGNTGSGKSNTLAKIYHELFSQMEKVQNFKKNSRFLLIDFNGEYGKENLKEGEVDEIITSQKKVYFLNTHKQLKDIKASEKIPLHEKDLINVELISILSNATDKTQKPFISRAIEFYKRVHVKIDKNGKENDPLEYFKNLLRQRLISIYKMVNKDKSHILVEYVRQILDVGQEKKHPEWNSTLNYFMSATKVDGKSRQIEEEEMKENDIYKEIDNYKFPTNAISKLIHFLYLQLIFDVYDDRAQNEHISPAVFKLKSKQKDIEKVLNTESDSSIFPENTNFVVISFKDANLEIKKTLPLIIAKKLYEEHKTNHENKSLHLIVDEAHNILSSESERESETWKDYRLETFEEIIKEGRKFNTFLTVASQRPFDISSTIISQLHNYFIHRLVNDYDIQALHKTVAYLGKLSFESIPILSVGSCFFAGLATKISIKVTIDLLPEKHRPKSGTISLNTIW